MLVLSRKASEVIRFPELNIEVEILRVRGSQVRVGVRAPREIRIVRGELPAVEENHYERVGNEMQRHLVPA